MFVYLSWKKIPKLLEKYPGLKKHLETYDFEKIKVEMEEAIDRIDAALFKKMDALLDDIKNDVTKYQILRGYETRPLPAGQEKPVREIDILASPQEEIDLNILKLIILEENHSFIVRFSKRKRLKKE